MANRSRLPSVTSSIPPDLRRWVDRVREMLDTITTTAERQGWSGFRGIGGGSGGGNDDGSGKPVLPCGVPVTPTAPTGLTVEAGFSGFLLQWDYPNYCGHGYTEVFGWKGDSRDTALSQGKLGSSTGRAYSHVVPSAGGQGQYWCFWARHVNILGEAGPVTTAAVCATATIDPKVLINILTGQITEGMLYGELRSSIQRLPNYNTQLSQLQELMLQGDGKLAYKAELLESATGDLSADVGDLKYAYTDPNGALAVRFSSLETRTTTAESNVTELSTSRIGYCRKRLKNPANSPWALTTDETKSLCEGTHTDSATYEYQWAGGLPLASAVKQVGVTYGGQTATLEQRMGAQATDDGLLSQYTVKIDNGGHVAGFGLASQPRGEAGIVSEFGVAADRFYVAPPVASGYSGNQAAMDAKTGTYRGQVFYRTDESKSYYWWKSFTGVDVTGASVSVLDINEDGTWMTSGTAKAQGWYSNPKYAVIPFIVSTGLNIKNSDGINIPAGVYMNSAYIGDATISSAKIGYINANKIRTNIAEAWEFKSPDFVSGTGKGFKVWSDGSKGYAELNSITIRDSSGNVLLNSGGLNLPDIDIPAYSPNKVIDSAFAQGTTSYWNWAQQSTVFAKNSTWPTSVPAGINWWFFSLNANLTTDFPIFANVVPMPVDPGKYYEASEYFASTWGTLNNVASRAVLGRIYVLWKDANKNPISPAAFGTWSSESSNLGTTDLNNWERLRGIFQAPSTAKYAVIGISLLKTAAINVTGSAYYAAFTRPHFGLANIDQSVVTPWRESESVWLDQFNASTYIADAAITRAMIANLMVNTADIADLAVTNAKIASLDVSKLNAGTIASKEIILKGAGSVIRSDGYVAGSSGWKINGEGNAEFGTLALRQGSASSLFQKSLYTDSEQTLSATSVTVAILTNSEIVLNSDHNGLFVSGNIYLRSAALPGVAFTVELLYISAPQTWSQIPGALISSTVTADTIDGITTYYPQTLTVSGYLAPGTFTGAVSIAMKITKAAIRNTYANLVYKNINVFAFLSKR